MGMPQVDEVLEAGGGSLTHNAKEYKQGSDS